GNLAETPDHLGCALFHDVAVEAEPEVLAVQQVGMAAISYEPDLETAGQEGLAGVASAGDQHQRRTMPILSRSIMGAYLTLDPSDVPPAGLLAPDRLLVPDPFSNDAAAGHIILVHEDEPARDLKVAVEIEGKRIFGTNRQLGYFVPADSGPGLSSGEIAGINDPVDRSDLAFDLSGRQAQHVLLVALQRAFPHPEKITAECGGDQRHRVIERGDFASFNEDLLVEHDPGGLACPRFRGYRFHIKPLDGLHVRRFIGWGEHEPVPNLHHSRSNAAGDDPAGVELVDVLNGKPQRLLFPLGLFPEQTEGFQHGRAAVPGHVGTLLHDIVSHLGADRYKPLRRDLKLRQEFPVFLLDSSIDV